VARLVTIVPLHIRALRGALGVIYLASCSLGLPTPPSHASNGNDVSLVPVFSVTSYSGGRKFATPQAVFVDQSRGDVYVADTNNGRIAVFDSQGSVVGDFRHYVRGDSDAEPVGVAVDKAGEICVTDSSSHVIYVYDIRGRQLRSIAPEASDRDAMFGRMTIDSSGRLYVTVRNKGEVFVFGPDRAFQRKVGDRVKPRMEMVSDVAVDANGRIYVVSSLGRAVHIFAPDGSLLSEFGEHAPGPENVSFPTSVDVDSAGRIWVTDSFAACVKVYTASGAFITNIGGFFFPVDIAVAPKENRLFVLEKNARRLSCLTIQQGVAGN
jgi:DNA-binding beta-propeller fold protein YncE